MKHQIIQSLNTLGISSPTSLKPYFPRVRDREDISVLQCENSGVIVLSEAQHMDLQHYEDKDDFSYWGVDDHRQASNRFKEDHLRRVSSINHLLTNQTLLDVGTGEGGILKYFIDLCKSVSAIEPQGHSRESLIKMGYDVKKDADSFEDESFDIATLFHVFEHLTDPITELKNVLKKVRPGGKVVLEVPHAKDLLLQHFNIESFKNFTFWSEHLILHSRQSLEAFMKSSGLVNISITGVQRHNLANHLHWLAKDKPGGHKNSNFLSNPTLDSAYAAHLASLDMTDTLVAIADKPL